MQALFARVQASFAQTKFLWVRRGCQASQRKGLTSGEVRETSREVGGTSGEVWGTSGEPLDCLGIYSERSSGGSRRRTSGEVRGTSGEVRGLSRSSGELDSLPATRQIFLQFAPVHETFSALPHQSPKPPFALSPNRFGAIRVIWLFSVPTGVATYTCGCTRIPCTLKLFRN